MVDGTSPNGRPEAYHETLFYKVEKWGVRSDGTLMGDENGEPLQNFYFPNSTHLTEHHFTDTQVKYGKKYIYRIYAFEVVVGTEYWYQLDQAPFFGTLQLVRK